jgi:pimeloyl-ACP methyl ester carboxylesterase
VLDDCLRQWDAGAEPGEFDTGRYRCRYVTWGRGPALVFIPGLSTDARSFVLPIARLRRDFRCVAYDLPTGAGDGANLAGYRHDDLRDDLLALLDHLGLDRAYLLGFSFGATVALSALAGRPRRFPRAVLVGGFARRRLAAAEVFLAHWARYWPGRLADAPLVESVLRRNHHAAFAGRPGADWQFFVEHSGRPAWRTFAHRALLLHQTDLRPLLPAVTQPVLLVHGDRDPLVPGAAQDELRRGLPNATRAEIEACGHQPQFTHPEVLAELVRQYLTPAATCAASGTAVFG